VHSSNSDKKQVSNSAFWSLYDTLFLIAKKKDQHLFVTVHHNNNQLFLGSILDINFIKFEVTWLER
jgi:hypothetical protein